MGLPFLTSSAKKRDHIVAIDLGGRITKGVYLQRKGDGFSLVSYTVQDAPVYEKSISPDLLAEHLKVVTQALSARTKQIILSLGVNDSIVRQADMPFLSPADLRMMVKSSPKMFLQQDFPGYVFDCFILPPKQLAKTADGDKRGSIAGKVKVMIGGAKSQLVDDVQAGIKAAGLVPDQIVPGILGPVNAFEMANPEPFAKEVVALVDLGFKNASITVLMEGEIMLSRVVGIGGDKITSGLAEVMGISYAEAEGIKVGMAGEVQSNLEPLLVPLGRELRASIDFFEHQQDKPVSQVFLSGGAARSEFFLQTLQNELMAPCKVWNPAGFLHMALPPQQMAEIEQVAPQLAVAVGAAVCGF
jgi:type IV pilus assembly protein PilM